MLPSEKNTQGSDVILHISENESEYLNESRLKEILDRYCSFMPVQIYFENEGEEKKEG